MYQDEPSSSAIASTSSLAAPLVTEFRKEMFQPQVSQVSKLFDQIYNWKIRSLINANQPKMFLLTRFRSESDTQVPIQWVV